MHAFLFWLISVAIAGVWGFFAGRKSVANALSDAVGGIADALRNGKGRK